MSHDKISPTKVALVDLDRTILRTEAFSRRVYEALGQMGFRQAILDQLQREQSESDQSYDYLARAYELIGSDPISTGTLWQLEDNIVRQGTKDGTITDQFRRDIVVSGASRLLDDLEDAGIVPIFCTAGGEITQRLKLSVLQKILRVNVPWIIIGQDQQHKAAMIAEVYSHDTGLFEFGKYASQATRHHNIFGNEQLRGIKGVYVIDDKWVNVTDIPENVPVVGILTEVAEYEDNDDHRVPLTEVMEVIRNNTIDK